MSAETDAVEYPESDIHAAPPVDLSIPQLTLRAILTGMLLGGVLSLCNIYSGLKIGWSFNMSVTAALLSYAFWQGAHRLFGWRSWNILENNVNQTAASAGASISSAGLVAPIPALTMLTDQEWTWPILALWVFSVALVGIVVAVGLRRQMLLVDKLPFPFGVATGETLKEMYARGKEAMAKVIALLVGAGVAAGLKITVTILAIKKLSLPGAIGGYSLKNLTFALDPSLLMVGLGMISGFRAGFSVLLGGIIAWAIVGPAVLDAGFVEGGAADKSWFKEMVPWMLWPGVAMMVLASLTSFAFSWRSVLKALRGGAGGGDADPGGHDVPRKIFIRALLVALVLSVILQFVIFDIGIGIAILAVVLSFVLAIVAARVTGETGITPIGAMGKVTQLTFGAVDPGSATSNLMCANVTGGAASQCGDLLHDMKTGLMVGASPRFLATAQFFGLLAGALVGSAAYLLLVPDPKAMLITEEWAAPAVAQWKAVAEVFTKGFEAMPQGAVEAIIWAGGAGILLAIAEKVAPRRVARWIPSPAAMGLAFVIPAYYAIGIFVGGLILLIMERVARTWTARFLIVIAAGLVAGESLTGIGVALAKIFGGG